LHYIIYLSNLTIFILRCTFIFIFFLGIAVATNPVWAEISVHLENKISKSAIHTLVFKNRYDIKKKLGFPNCSKTLTSNVIIDSPNESG